MQPDEVLKDPALEKRAREISAGLRCLVCQNQSIDDSDAQLAKDLRLLVRERLRGRRQRPQVRDYLVQRYGEFVLLRPTFRARPCCSGSRRRGPRAGRFRRLMAIRRRPQPVGAPEADEEQKALEALLKRAQTDARVQDPNLTNISSSA